MYAVMKGTDETTCAAFLEVTQTVYAADPNYVAESRLEVRRQLDTGRNPLFQQHQLELFVCFHNSRPVARIAVVSGKEKSLQSQRATFGYFECVEDITVFRTMLLSVESACIQQGITTIEGPFSPSQYGTTGLQVDGFGSRPAFLEPYNPPYYRDFFTAAGFRVSQTGRTWRSTRSKVLETTGAFDAEESNRFFVKPIESMSVNTLHDIATIIESAFGANWGSSPISLEEYSYVAEGLAPAFKSGLAFLVECDSKPVGVVIMLLDINELRKDVVNSSGPFALRRLDPSEVRSVVVYAMGIIPERRHTKAGLLLASQFRRIASDYDKLTSTWITKGNRASEQLAERFGFQPVKTFEVYVKDL